MANYEKENKKLEKQNARLKKKNKAGGKIILVLLLIIAILAAVIFFFDPFGFGIGPNARQNGGGNVKTPAATTAATAQAETEAPEADPTLSEFKVTVSGATYLLEDKTETTAEKIVALFKESNSKTLVRIIDESATQNAMEDLKKALDAEKIPYSIGDQG